jgi:O-antigen ligase
MIRQVWVSRFDGIYNRIRDDCAAEGRQVLSQLTLRFLLYSVAITLTIGALQYKVAGLRLIASDVLGLFFAGFFLLTLLAEDKYRIKLPPSLRNLLILFFIFYCAKLLSVLGVASYNSRPDAITDIALRQYAKGVIKDGFGLLLLVCLAAYLTMIDSLQRRRVLGVFVLGVLASCVYQVVSLVVIKSVGVDLDRLLWPALSYNLGEDYTFLSDQAFGVGGTVFYRAGGFAINPNSFAAQLACVIPFLTLSALYRRRSYMLWMVPAMLAMLSLLLTVSRSGMLAVGIAGFLLLLGQFHRIVMLYKLPIIVVGIVLTAVGIAYGDELMTVLGTRLNQQNNYGFLLGKREDLFRIGIQTVADNPLFGVGHNNSPLQLYHFPQVLALTGPDFHNFWLIKLIELGVVGFSAYLFIHLFILWRMWRAHPRNIYAKGLFYTLIGLSVAAFFNNNLAVTSIQLLVFVFFCVACLEDKTFAHPANYRTEASIVKKSA